MAAPRPGAPWPRAAATPSAARRSSAAALALELGRPVIERLELVEPSSGLGRVGDDVGEVLAVLPPQLPQEPPPRLDSRQAFGIVDDALAGVTRVGRDVGELDGDDGQPATELPERPVLALQGGQRGADGLPRAPVAVERLVRESRR
jgi:hypothetical protein